MQGMISRYRDRLSNSISEIKALSASREKSISNNNNTTSNNLQSQSILVMNTIPSTQSLTKHSKQPLQQQIINNTSGKLLHNQLFNENNQSNLIIASSLKQLPQHKYNLNSSNNNNNLTLLPPQPNTHTKQRLKQSSISISTPNANDHTLKSSRKTKQKQNTKTKQKQFIKQIHRQKQSDIHKDRSNSKSKKHSRVSNKKPTIVQLTPQQLTQSFSQSIFEVFANEIKQKNVLINNNNVNVTNLINKQELKVKISIFLQQYWEKRYQVLERERMVQREMNEQYQQQRQMKAQPHSIINPFITSHLAQHTITPPQTSSSFTNQLQKRFFQTQKQRQFLQKKVQSLTKKIQSLTKQLQRYVRLQRLVNNTIESQNEARKEVNRLRRELQYSELKNSQQQKIWRKETVDMRQVIQELRVQLKNKYECGESDSHQ